MISLRHLLQTWNSEIFQLCLTSYHYRKHRSWCYRDTKFEKEIRPEICQILPNFFRSSLNWCRSVYAQNPSLVLGLSQSFEIISMANWRSHFLMVTLFAWIANLLATLKTFTNITSDASCNASKASLRNLLLTPISRQQVPINLLKAALGIWLEKVPWIFLISRTGHCTWDAFNRGGAELLVVETGLSQGCRAGVSALELPLLELSLLLTKRSFLLLLLSLSLM